ncbi:ATP-binding cassette domain-containing protein [Curvibacter sp. CHRR-16]|uniref:ATP-binding cassette domain-containing protein n=1 Tax=Curvibacter sp. CHRR-16 TaxID=2835872 RepID=UPI001BD962CA|nr:ATP-binding cassette domain-containing protein [Curvibacter sp. CHRR-16]MBT0568869.1 ATP-binding cassette domain-containing protein [Curvibacter sp. CHRR-16]
MPDVLLRLDSACIQLGRGSHARAMGPFNLQLQAGERVAVLGPSGAGKSSLLRLLAAEWDSTQGHVHLQGRPMQHWSLPALSRARAVLPQSHEVAFGLPTDLVVGLGRVALHPDPQGAHIVRQAAAAAQASHLLGRRFDTLSGGEKARIQLARVLAQLWDVEGGLVLVDEPVAALDPGLQWSLLDALHAFVQQRGHALVAVLHDVQQALDGFGRWCLVQHGVLQADLRDRQALLQALPSLYGVPFVQALTDTGQLLLSPGRNQQSV